MAINRSNGVLLFFFPKKIIRTIIFRFLTFFNKNMKAYTIFYIYAYMLCNICQIKNLATNKFEVCENKL